ncbi:MAG: TolC family outer membrane protein [Herbaspirillum sp.]
MRHIFLTPLIAGVLSYVPYAAAHAADLSQIYQQALANDPVYQSARHALRAGAEKITQGRAAILPVIGIGGSYTRSGDSMQNSVNTYTLQLTQPLLRMANWETYRQGELSAAIDEVQSAQARQDLILRVSLAYFDVLGTQDALRLLQAQKSAISEQLAAAKRNFDIGTATITDTNEAQARYDLASAQEIAAQNELDAAFGKLQRITGQPLVPLSTLRANVQLDMPQPAQIEPWISSAEQQNHGVVARQAALEIAQSDIRRSRAGHYPAVDLVAGRNYLNQNSQLTPYTNGRGYANSIGVQWHIPLYSGFSVSSKVDESIALADKARADLENARRTAAFDARQAYLGVSNGLSQVKAYEAAEISSLSALESNRLGYQVGVRINIDVLDAQRQLFAARRDLARARYDTLMSGLKLKAAAGNLGEDDLVNINRLLEAPASD